jgi:hypothetical protein
MAKDKKGNRIGQSRRKCSEEAGVRSPESGDRDQETGIRRQGSGDRDQETGIRNQDEQTGDPREFASLALRTRPQPIYNSFDP